MAEEPEAPSRSTGTGIGAKLSKKLGPLPVWGWALGVGGLAFLGYRYWASKQAVASSSTAATAVGAGTSTTDTGMSGSDSSGGGGGGYSDGGGGQLATLLQTLQTQLQSGGAGTGSQPGYSLLTSVGAITAVRNAGQQLYEQLSPGVFTAYNGGIPGAAGIPGQPGATPLYALSNGTVAASTGATTAAGVSGAAAPTTTTGPSAPAIAGSPAGAVAATTPSPAVSPVTSGPTPVAGGSLGGGSQGGAAAGTQAGTLLPATGPLV